MGKKQVLHSDADTPLPDVPVEPPSEAAELFIKTPMFYTGTPQVVRDRVINCPGINQRFTIHRTLVYPSGARLPYASPQQWERYKERTGYVE